MHEVDHRQAVDRLGCIDRMTASNQETGWLLVRNIAMQFDRYLQQGQPLVRYSKTI